ncbi:MAG: hypothetical protein PHQ75_09710, partial [Thermoguttaceae bacterium]|nr:hypothetical protein [Thermoguttaceae bacterium]
MKCIPGHIENRLGFVTKRLTVWLVCLVVVLAALTLETHLNAAKAQDLETPVRQRIPLDGTWDFSLKEPAPLPAATVNQGHVKTSGTIQVPGIWEVQGYGQPTDKVRHLHVGKATYKRTVSIPADWKGKEIVIVLEGFQRYAQVSINDRIAGPELLDGVVANEVRVDHLLVPGKEATVSVCVDSEQRWPVDAIMSCAALNHVDRGEFVHFPWGGLWGHVWLEARSSTRITDHLIRYQFAQNRCKAEVVVKSPKADDYLLRLNVCELNGTVLASQTVKCPVESDRNTSHS